MDQVHAIGCRNSLFPNVFSERSEASLIPLECALDEAIADFPGGAFARLGSRSAKDTPTAILTGCRVETGKQVIALLTDRSRRVAFDLRLCVRHAYSPWIFLRDWRDFHWSTEFRCFLFEGELVGVSEYHHAVTAAFEYDKKQIAMLDEATRMLANRLRQVLGSSNVVFDIFMTWQDPPIATLIELNPWGTSTDPCLFSWDNRDFDGSIRFRPP